MLTQDSLPQESGSPAPRFLSAMSRFPGRPLPLARRLTVHNRVLRSVRAFMDQHGYHEVPAPVTDSDAYLAEMIARGFPGVWCHGQQHPSDSGPASAAFSPVVRAAGSELNGSALQTLLRDFLRSIVQELSADLLGGRQVTRLDRVLTCEPPHLNAAQAATLLADKGHTVAPGALTDSVEAAADVSRFCQSLPVLLTDLPATAADGVEEVGCLLPYSGLSLTGTVYRGEIPRGVMKVDMNRLLQFLMGLEFAEDARIDPFMRGPFPRAAAAEA